MILSDGLKQRFSVRLHFSNINSVDVQTTVLKIPFKLQLQKRVCLPHLIIHFQLPLPPQAHFFFPFTTSYFKSTLEYRFVIFAKMVAFYTLILHQSFKTNSSLVLLQKPRRPIEAIRVYFYGSYANGKVNSDFFLILVEKCLY